MKKQKTLQKSQLKFKFQSYVRKLRLKVSELTNEQKQLILFCLGAFLIILVGLTSIFIFQNKFTSKEDDIVKEDINGTKNVDITLSEDGFDIKSVKLKPNTEYNFRVIKTDEVSCTSLKNNELDYTIPLPNIADQFPIRFPESKTYNLTCIENPKLKITVNVR